MVFWWGLTLSQPDHVDKFERLVFKFIQAKKKTSTMTMDITQTVNRLSARTHGWKPRKQHPDTPENNRNTVERVLGRAVWQLEAGDAGCARSPPCIARIFASSKINKTTRT